MRLIVLITFFTCAIAHAEFEQDRFFNELSEGMPYHEVLKAWGAPESKIEQESKRVDIWVYDDSRVRFYEGKLVGIERMEGNTAVAEDLEVQTVDASNGQPDVAVADILNEIMDASASSSN